MLVEIPRCRVDKVPWLRDIRQPESPAQRSGYEYLLTCVDPIFPPKPPARLPRLPANKSAPNRAAQSSRQARTLSGSPPDRGLPPDEATPCPYHPTIPEQWCSWYPYPLMPATLAPG